MITLRLMRGSLLLACVMASTALAGCTVHYSSRSESAAGSVQVNATSGSPLGNAIIVAIVVADAVRYYRLGPDGRIAEEVPPPDPTRKINVQDCTKPVDLSAGNLMCR
jgi:hypothetical protein